jgi:autotransporter-associated beta strand protein
LTAGSITTGSGSLLSVAGGVFTGSLRGSGQVQTTGVLNIGAPAVLDSSLSQMVTSTGSLTFASSRNIGTLNNSGNVTFSNGGSWTSQTGSGTVTVAGGTLSVVTGSGSLVVGSLGTARYSGGVTLSAVTNSGILELAAGSTLNAVNSTGTLLHFGSLTISGGSVSSLSGGNLTSLTKAGAGTLTLGGTYAGSTYVTAGTLSLLDKAKLLGDVTVNGGNLLLGGTNQFGGNLTLLSGMVDLGGYAQVLVGSSTFAASGGVFGKAGETAFLNATALNITGGTLNALTGLIGGGTQTFTGSLNFPTIAKSGSTDPVVVSGVGAIVSTGTIYAPVITVGGSSNMLVLLGGSSTAASQTATFTITGSNNMVDFQQGFAPTGNLVLTVGDASSQGGSLRVGGAGLVLGGSQTLKGKGTIVGNVRLGAGANLAPGNSPGVITVAGTLVSDGATVSIEFDRAAPAGVQQDQVVVAAPGTVTINGGTLSLNLGTGASRFRPGVDKFYYDIFLSSGSAATGVAKAIQGTGFSSLVTPAGAGFSLVNGALSFSVGGFSRIGATGNLAATGALVDQAFANGIYASTPGASSLGSLMDNAAFLASTDKATVAATLAALDPAVYADLGNIGLDRLRDVQAGLSNHLDMLALDAVGESSLSLAVKPGQSAAAAAVEQSRAWTTAYGGWGKRSSDSTVGAAGYSSNNYGDVSGVETKVGALTLGLTGALGSSTATFENGKGKVTADSWHTGLYGSLPAGRVVLDAAFAYGQSDSTLKRSVNVAGGGATSGKSQGTEWTGQIGVAVPFRADGGSLMITPSLHLLHSSVKQDALTESSLNGLEAVVKGKTTDSTAIRTGVQAAKLTKLAGKATRLTASLDWVHSFESDRKDVEIALAGAGTATSRFQGSKTGQDAIRIGLGAEFTLTERTRFRLNLDEQIKSGVNSTYGSATFGVQF